MNRKKTSLPRHINVHVQKGDSGALIATLEKYNSVTEADNLIELFFNVNDLIYTIFDISKKDQESIQFIPSKEAQVEMLNIAESPLKRVEKQFEINRFVRDNNPGIVTL